MKIHLFTNTGREAIFGSPDFLVRQLTQAALDEELVTLSNRKDLERIQTIEEAVSFINTYGKQSRRGLVRVEIVPS